MQDWRDLAQIKRLTRVEGVLINETPLRIGVGSEPPIGAPVDLAVYRVNGKPCIPGSSLKGAFRALLESIAVSNGYPVHSPWSEEAKKEGENGKFCLICGIFGSTELASHVRIYDAYPADDTAKSFIKTSISVNREFGAVQPGALFTEEYVEPKTRWSFRMDIINIQVFREPEREDPRAKLLKSLFDTLMKFGINIGARKTVGCGLIKLEKGKWEVFSFSEGLLKREEEGSLE